MKISVAALLLLTICLLSACGQKGGSTSDPDSKTGADYSADNSSREDGSVSETQDSAPDPDTAIPDLSGLADGPSDADIPDVSVPCPEGSPLWECGLPEGLPFQYSREADGEPIGEAETAEFTEKITGLWRQADYFNWLYETNHGVDESTGLPEYLIWWHDVDAVKSGDTVTFRHNSMHGGSHNNAEPTSQALTQCIAGYLLTGDPMAGKLAALFARSFTAMMTGFVFDESDDQIYVMARNIVTQNHSFTLPSGKKKAIDYTDWYNSYEGWNADRYHYPNNPTWGDIWVTTMRSKDDLPYMFRSTAWLPYIIKHSNDKYIRDSAIEAWEYMRGFAKDIVDFGYYIRSKDSNGVAYIPEEDLASFMDYVSIMPDAECDARYAIAMLAYGEPLTNDCGSGQGSLYDEIAGDINYYNYSIIDGFHMNAVHLALIFGRNDEALSLLKGLATRIARYRNPETCAPGCEDESWGRDVALLLLESASLGLPLTWTEARQVQHYFLRAAELYSEFPNWDLWSESVSDGTYDFRSGFHPGHTPEAIRAEDMAMLLEYCWSPFRNPAGVNFVDCSKVSSIENWGDGSR